MVESRLENHRIRKVTIFYFLEDKSVQITEPKQVNSGVPQGAFLKRQMILKSDGSGAPFMPQDFGIGTDIAIHGRVYRLYGCDDYTRQFFGVSLIISNYHDLNLKWKSVLLFNDSLIYALLTVHAFCSCVCVV